MAGGRRLEIVHRSGYRYVTDVVASFNEVRMTPAEVGGQLLVSHTLEVEPGGLVHTYRDYWGAVVEAFDIHQPHRVMEVVASSVVLTPAGHPGARGVDWSDIAEPAVQDRYCEYLMPTGYVDEIAPDDPRYAMVAQLRGLASPADAVRAAVANVHEHMTYTPGVTSVFTTSGQAWETGQGVCQDFAHATLSLLRTLRIPARYVSGYLHSKEEAVGETVVGESHAWIEAWFGGWEAFDPTNHRTVGSAHVKVASGRDYLDVPPLKGLYAGGGSEALGVEVQITQLAGDEQMPW